MGEISFEGHDRRVDKVMRFENVVKEKIKSVEKRYYVTIVSSMIFGLLAHLYQFTNKIFNYDELGQTPAGFGAGVSLGRWGLQIVGDFVGHFFRNYSIPMINGIITLLFVVISACVLVEVFDIQDKVCCFLIGGILAVYPALVATYFFMFTAPYYGFAFALSCLAGKMIVREKPICMASGILLLTFATAIYQSYCAVALCILLIYIVIKFYVGNADWKELLKSGIVYCTSFAISIILYVIGTKISVAITGIQLDGYRGLDNMSISGTGDIVKSIYYSYRDYILLMTKKDIYQINPITLASIIFIVINCVNLFFFVKRVCKKEELMSKIGYVISTALIPIALFFPEVLMQGQGGIYSIMTYSTAFVFLFPIVIYDKYARANYEECVKLIDASGVMADKRDYVGAILGFSTFICIMIYVWFANGNYQAMQYTNYHDLAYFETLATQVKSLDGYTSDMPIAFAGEFFYDPTFNAGSLMGEYFDIGGKWDTNVNYFNNIYLWTSYLGYTPEIIEFRDSNYLFDNPEIVNMPQYPNDGSIKIIDGMVVIRGSSGK